MKFSSFFYSLWIFVVFSNSIFQGRDKKQNNICEMEIKNLSPIKHQIFSSESSMLSTLWVLAKLYQLYKSCRRNAIETFR